MQPQPTSWLDELFGVLPATARTRSLPARYFTEMMSALRRQRFRSADTSIERTKDIAQHLYGRWQQCLQHTVTWVRNVFDLRKADVIEVGCGTGSSTAAFGKVARSVHAIDICADSVACATTRCRLLGVDNVRFDVVPQDWIGRLERGDLAPEPESVHAVLCHAVLEHLLPAERLALLGSIWRSLAPGGVLIVVETQNRLHFYDWHSSWLMFYDVLPDDLASVYLGRTSRRDTPPAVISSRVQSFDEATRTKLYRWGRGMSFHEFELAIGLDNLRVLADASSPGALPRGAYFKEDAAFAAALQRVLTGHRPAVHPGFLQPSLDLVLQKPAR